MHINDLINEAHQTAVKKGWWDGPGERSAGDQFANFHGEISEAWEEWRKFGWLPEAMLYTDVQFPNGNPAFALVDGDKPEGIAAELADALIRIADTCGRYDIPLVKALEMKLAYNKTRPYRHGGKQA